MKNIKRINKVTNFGVMMNVLQILKVLLVDFLDTFLPDM